MADIVDIAIKEIGIKESTSGHMKYIKWYGGFGSGTPWCAIFVSWCIKQSGLSSPKQSSVQGLMDWFKKNNSFKNRGNYTPKRGDIIIFKSNGRSHAGIVEKVSGSKVHTVEGNTSNQVARRNYALTNNTITGYGLLKSTGSTSSKSSSSSTELEYLKKLNSMKTPTLANVNAEVKASTKHANVDVKVRVTFDVKTIYEITVLDDMQVSWERTGTAGKLTFKTIYNKTVKLKEGLPVLLIVDKVKIFYGFIFTIQHGKDGIVSVTVYDQLRYLKNKDTFIYRNKTATQIIKSIAKANGLKCGDLANTTFTMSRIEDDQTYFDMIQNALDETLLNSSKLYTMYDKVGKITLTNTSKMILNSCLIDKETAQDYSFSSSIDSDTYNQIKLGFENDKTGKIETYIVKNTKKINEWGLLQYYEKIDDPKLGALKAKALMKVYGSKTRNLSVSGAIGNVNVRAGNYIPVMLSLGETKVQNYMLVEKVVHKFSNRVHIMDLTLSGGGFSA